MKHAKLRDLTRLLRTVKIDVVPKPFVIKYAMLPWLCVCMHLYGVFVSRTQL